MEEKNLHTAEFEEVDPNLFIAAANQGNKTEMTARRSVIPDEENAAGSSEPASVSEESPAAETGAEVVSNATESVSEPDSPQASQANEAASEPELSTNGQTEEPLNRAEKRRLKKEAKKQEKLAARAKKKGGETGKVTIEEQYLSDENGARKRFRSWKFNNTLSNVILVASAGIFLVCAIELGAYFYSSYRYAKSMSDLEDGMGGGIDNDDALKRVLSDQTNGDVLVFPDEEAYDVVAAVSHDNTISDTWKDQYEYLTSVNSDCIGYISIPDTVLSYPVLFTPSDYTYYLYRNFSGEYEYRGSIFLDYQTKIGQSQNIIIYGHNMTDGLMFGTLREYLDKSYYEDHKYVYFNTAVSEGIYEVMAVVKTKIYTVEDTCFKYYKYGGVLTKDEFEMYVREMLSMSEYKTGVTAEWGDELISLSTCNHYTDEGRLVIVCKRIN